MPDAPADGGEWIDAGAAEPAATDEIRAFTVAGTDIALTHADGEWLAFEDACTHHDCPLADGFLEGATIECACHGSIFDMRSGEVVRGPAAVAITVYAVRTEAGRVLVRVLGEAATTTEG